MSSQKIILISCTLCAMLGSVFAASLPQVNIGLSAHEEQIKPNENTITYSYDVVSPLKLSKYTNSVSAYNTGIASLQYNAQNEIISDDHDNVLNYDALGEMVSFTNAQTKQQVAYQYDVENHQSTEAVQDTKENSCASQVFYYSSGDQAQLISESDSDGDQLSYLFAETKIGSINNTDQADLYITDQAGSVIALASNTGLTHQYLYSPYGIETDLDQSSAKAKNAQGFDGERTDKATGYQFLGNGYRAYNSILHRFMQMDDIRYSPFGKAGINGYVFANNNPVMNFDPSGHDAWYINLSLALGAFTLSLATGFVIDAFIGVGEGLEAELSSEEATSMLRKKAISKLLTSFAYNETATIIKDSQSNQWIQRLALDSLSNTSMSIGVLAENTSILNISDRVAKWLGYMNGLIGAATLAANNALREPNAMNGGCFWVSSGLGILIGICWYNNQKNKWKNDYVKSDLTC